MPKPLQSAIPLLILMTMAAMAPAQSSQGIDSPWIALNDIEVRAPQLASDWTNGVIDRSGWMELPGIAINAQGGGYGQNDFSIRGSSFSGAGYSLGGLALRQPQTEHFNAELPLPPELFQRPRVLTGLAQSLESSAHPVGSIGLNLAPASTGGSLLLRGGSRGLRSASLLQHLSYTRKNGSRLSVGGFGAAEDAEGVDFPSNDSERRSGGGHVQYLGERTQFDLLVAAQERTFGARGYYGVTPALEAEESIDDLLSFASLQRHYGGDGGYVRTSLLWRRMHDHYLLYLPQPTPYENRHRSRITSAALDGRHPFTTNLLLNWRLVAEQEEIESARLGDYERTRGEFRLIPQLSLGAVDLYAGAGGYALEDEDNRLSPIAGTRINVGGGWQLFADYIQTLRQPSYTELNYESPGSLGNAGLESELTDAVEFGIQRQGDRLSGRVAAFYRRTRHAVDWVKATAATNLWTATDVGEVETRGVELIVNWQPLSSLGFQGSYTGLDKENDLDPFAGRYVLDYARHAARLAVEWRPCASFRMTYGQSFRRYEDNPLRSDDTGTSGDVAVYLTCPRYDQITLGLGCDNVSDEDFDNIIGVPADERRAWASLSARWQ